MADGTPPAPAVAPPTQAAVALAAVSFREVTAVYDLHGRRRVVDTDRGPALIYDMARFDATAAPAGRYVEDVGKATSRVTGGMTGVHQVVDIERTSGGLSTFSRAHASTIAGKWIYMFASTDKAGANMKLEAELFADGGELQLVDLAAQAGKDVRAPSGTKRRAHHVEFQSIARGGRSLWFLLAPHQIAWGRLQEMAATGTRLASRCHRLFDEFWTDGTVDGTTAQPLWELQDAARANARLGYVMYLVDPLAEAVRRATAYNTTVDVWQRIATDLARDDEYRLAKRIHALPAEYANRVWHALGPYLAAKEKNQRLLLGLASGRLEDLLWWVGASRRRGRTAFGGGRPPLVSDTWYMTATGLGASREDKADRAPYNAFSQLVADYDHAGTPDATASMVAKVVALVHARIGALPDGQEFLAKIMKVALDGALPVADAGASMLFEAKRKSAATAAEVASGVLEHYANAWTAAYRADALPRLVAFARKRLSLELRLRHPHEVGRAMESIARRAHNKVAKGGIERLAAHYHVEVDPLRVRALGLTKAMLDRLVVGFEAFNLAASLQALRAEKDPWTAIGLLGSTIDAYSAIAKLYPRLETVRFTYGKTAVAIEIGSKLSILSSAIDVVLGARDAIAATNPAQRTGHVMRTVGAYLTLGGTIFRATPVGVVMSVVGLALQAGGSAVAAANDDMSQFLRHCRWGERTKLDGVMGVVASGNGLGYAGDLADLHADITAQHRALDWLFYRFTPSVRFFNGAGLGVPSRIYVRTKPPPGLGPKATWKMSLEIVGRSDNRVLRRYEYAATTPEDHVYLSSDDEIAILEHTSASRTSNQPSMSARWGDVRVRGTIELDVFGDGQSIVTRKVDAKLDLPF